MLAYPFLTDEARGHLEELRTMLEEQVIASLSDRTIH
jgi:hypothetical protein